MNKLFKYLLIIITAVIFYFILTQRWIGKDGQRWRSIIESDGRGYYAYLPAIFIYQDLYYDFILRDEVDVYGKGGAQYLFLKNGQHGNKYFPGVALLLTPFFLLALFVSWLTGHSLNGYNKIFFGSVSIGALFYFILGLIYIRKLLKLYGVRDGWIFIIILMVSFGTNVFHYAVYEPAMSHIYSFAAMSIFLFNLKKFQIDNKKVNLFASAFMLGIIALIRPVNGLIVLAVPFLAGNFDDFKKLIRDIFKNKKDMAISIFLFSMIVFIQPLILYLTYGTFFRWNYVEEGFDFLHPHFIDTLFSYRKGLFIYTPFIFIAIASILYYLKRSIYQVVCFIGFFFILNYVLSSWSSWYYGGSFGLRAFLEFYPLFIIPLAIGLNLIKNKFSIAIISILFGCILTLNLIQTYQYEHNILHFSEMDKEKYWKVFLHTAPKYKLISYPMNSDSLIESDIIKKKIILNDFEGSVHWDADNTITTEEHYSGNHSSKILVPNPYSPAFKITYKEMKVDSFSFVKVRLMAKTADNNNESELVISFESKTNQIYNYQHCSLISFQDNMNDWFPVEYNVKFPPMEDTDIMKIYVWNEDKKPLYIDDFQLELYSLKK